jgi:zinc transport system substrate-binding protein
MQQSVVLLLLLLTACGGGGLDRSSGKITVLVSVVPQKYFVEKIAGDIAEVTVLIPPGANPAAFEISPSGMRVVNDADVWFTLGLQRETTWLPEFSSINDSLRIVSTISGIARMPIGRYGIPGEHNETAGGDPDPHVWLSPAMVRLQAEAICEALCETDPENQGIYTQNLAVFLEEIDALQIQIHSMLDKHSGGGFMVFHPAWGYFADEFNLVQVPIEIAGSEPSPGEMAGLISYGRNSSVKIVFVSPQFSEVSAETIAEEMNASVAFIDPLAPDWSDNLLFVAQEISQAMERD